MSFNPRPRVEGNTTPREQNACTVSTIQSATPRWGQHNPTRTERLYSIHDSIRDPALRATLTGNLPPVFRPPPIRCSHIAGSWEEKRAGAAWWSACSTGLV